MNITLRRLSLGSMALLTSLALAACSGNYAGSPPFAQPTACPGGQTGTAPNCAPATATSSVTPSSTQATQPALPAAGGVSGNINLPAAISGTTPIAVTTSVTPPAGVPTLKGHLRAPRSTTGANIALLYVGYLTTSNVTLNGIPGYSLTLPPSIATGSSIYVAQYNATAGTWNTILGPVTTAGSTLNIPAGNGTLNLAANQSSYFAIYAGSIVTPAAAQITLSMSGQPPVTGIRSTQTLTVTEKDASGNVISGTYASPVTLSTNDTTGAITLSATSVTAAGQTVTLTYNGGAIAANAAINAVDGNNKTATLAYASNTDNPLVDGSTATFNVASTTTTTYSGGAQPRVNTLTDTRTTTVHNNATYNGKSGLIDLNVSTQRLNTNPPNMPPFIVDSYVLPQYAADGSLQLLQYADTISAAIPGNLAGYGHFSYNDQYAAPYPVLEVLPHTATYPGPYFGNFTAHQSNTYVTSSTGNRPSASTWDEVAKADGSYNQSISYTYPGASAPVALPAHTWAQSWTLNADGSGTSVATNTYPGGLPSTLMYTDTFAYGVPNGATIPVTETTVATPGAAPTVIPTVKVPNWLPNQTVPQPLQTGTIAQSTATIPASCNLPAGYPTTGTVLQFTQSVTDPVNGILDTTQGSTYYVSGIGQVCYISTDTFRAYDNQYSGSLYMTMVNNTTVSIVSSSLKTSAVTRSAKSIGGATAPLMLPVIQSVLRQNAAQNRALLKH